MDVSYLIRKLPDTEFEVMKAVWDTAAPMNVNNVVIKMDKKWRIQTLITLMHRLIKRGFIRTEKVGNDRLYYPIITREDYLEFETTNFIKNYHENSLINLVTALYENKGLSDDDIDELLKWAKEMKE